MSKRHKKVDRDRRDVPEDAKDNEAQPMPPGLIALFLVPLVLLVVWALMQ